MTRKADRDIPEGRVLIVGPTGSGKTRRTASDLRVWVQENGPEGVFVLEFAPEHQDPDGRVLGRRLRRFVAIPEGVHYVEVPTRAPRAQARTAPEAIRIAAANAEACRVAFRQVPGDLRALFVNDATIPFHVPGADPGVLLRVIEQAEVAVVNALDPEGFDPEHPVTKQERAVLARIEGVVQWVRRMHEPGTDVYQKIDGG